MNNFPPIPRAIFRHANFIHPLTWQMRQMNNCIYTPPKNSHPGNVQVRRTPPDQKLRRVLTKINIIPSGSAGTVMGPKPPPRLASVGSFFFFAVRSLCQSHAELSRKSSQLFSLSRDRLAKFKIICFGNRGITLMSADFKTARLFFKKWL